MEYGYDAEDDQAGKQKTCPNCHKTIEGGRFCPNCGYDFQKKQKYDPQNYRKIKHGYYHKGNDSCGPKRPRKERKEFTDVSPETIGMWIMDHGSGIRITNAYGYVHYDQDWLGGIEYKFKQFTIVYEQDAEHTHRYWFYALQATDFLFWTGEHLIEKELRKKEEYNNKLYTIYDKTWSNHYRGGGSNQVWYRAILAVLAE